MNRAFIPFTAEWRLRRTAERLAEIDTLISNLSLWRNTGLPAGCVSAEQARRIDELRAQRAGLMVRLQYLTK